MRLRIGLVLVVLAGLLAWMLAGSQGVSKHAENLPSRRRAPLRLGDAKGLGPSALPRAREVDAPRKLAKALLRELCVRDAQGDPVSDLALVLYCSDTSRPLSGGFVITDEDGCVKVQLCADPEALTCARLRDAGHRPTKAWILRPEETSFEFSLAAPAVVTGQLRTGGQEAVVGAQLWFEPEDPDPWSAPPFVQMRLKSDAQGAFFFVAARPLPCDPCVRDEQDCELQRRVDEPDAPVPGTIWIRHREHGLKAVPMPQQWGAMDPVVLDGRRTSLRGELAGPGAKRAKLMLVHATRRKDRQVTKVDDKGVFEFAGLGSGNYELSVFLDGDALLRISKAKAGDTLSLTLPRQE